MNELISGKSAYNLIGQGVEVQAHVEYEKGLLEWQDAKELPACDILNGRFDFRLKPRTITLNGVEVPAPFTATHADGLIWYFNCGFDECYGSMVLDESDTPLHMAWRTEEEIKLVVAELRKVFNP